MTELANILKEPFFHVYNLAIGSGESGHPFYGIGSHNARLEMDQYGALIVGEVIINTMPELEVLVRENSQSLRFDVPKGLPHFQKLKFYDEGAIEEVQNRKTYHRTDLTELQVAGLLRLLK